MALNWDKEVSYTPNKHEILQKVAVLVGRGYADLSILQSDTCGTVNLEHVQEGKKKFQTIKLRIFRYFEE